LLTFFKPAALWANATASIDIPTWRYYFNASFSNTQVFPRLGAFHASEIPIVFHTYPDQNTTTQQHALSSFMQGAWARFARNPAAGPGWNRVGTGSGSLILSGADDQVRGGLYIGSNLTSGEWNLGVLGDVGDVRGGGVTVLPQTRLDYRCNLFRPIFETVVGSAGMPPSR
jgi:acetylcholinesterase